MAENGTLSTKQSKAIVALLSTKTVAEAARLADCGERTIWAWLNDPVFRAALVSAEGDAIDRATRRLIGLQDSAVDTLAWFLDNPATKDAIKLRAAQSVLDYLLKLRELRNVEARLTELEKRYAGN